MHFSSIQSKNFMKNDQIQQNFICLFLSLPSNDYLVCIQSHINSNLKDNTKLETKLFLVGAGKEIIFDC
jgi:hypothetical protein